MANRITIIGTDTAPSTDGNVVMTQDTVSGYSAMYDKGDLMPTFNDTAGTISLVRQSDGTVIFKNVLYSTIQNGNASNAVFASYAALKAYIGNYIFTAPGTGGGGGGTANPYPGSDYATSAKQDNVIANTAKIPSQGQAAMAASTPVVIANNQSAIPVSGTFYQATQPISAVSLPLPTGASTATAQATQLTAQQAIQAGIGSPTDVSATTDTGTFSLISLTKRFLSKIPILGQATKSNSLPVTIASDQGPLSIISTGVLRTEVSASGSIATGGTAQTAAAANGTGQKLKIQNLSSEVLWFSFTNTNPSAMGADCFSLAPYSNGSSGYYETSDPITNALYIFGATTGSKYSLIKS